MEKDVAMEEFQALSGAQSDANKAFTEIPSLFICNDDGSTTYIYNFGLYIFIGVHHGSNSSSNTVSFTPYTRFSQYFTPKTS